MRFSPTNTPSRLVLGLAAAVSSLALGAGVLPAQAAAPAAAPRTSWAPAETAAIHPGVQMYTNGAQCTANFVYTDDSGATYVGYAAHCAGLGEATDTNGCQAESLPLGTPVTFNEGGSLVDEGTVVGRGKLVYSSWLAMHQNGEGNANACAYNDLALVKVDAADVGKVNPSIPIWGGPVGINTTGTKAGDRVYSYGNSSLRAGVELLSPKIGISLGDNAADGGWSHPLYTLTPGVPGDSGSAFLDGEGRAVGTLSTLGLLPCRCRTTSATSTTSWPTPSSTPASAGCAWCRAPSRSTRFSDPSRKDPRPAPPAGGSSRGGTDGATGTSYPHAMDTSRDPDGSAAGDDAGAGGVHRHGRGLRLRRRSQRQPRACRGRCRRCGTVRRGAR